MKPQVKWLVLIYVSISIQSNPTLFFSSIPLSFSLNDGKPPNYTHFPSNLFSFQKWNWFKTKTRRTPSARTAHCKYWLVCTAVVVVSFDFDWCVPKTVELKRTLIYGNAGCVVFKQGVQKQNNKHAQRKLLYFENWINGGHCEFLE